MVLISPVMKTPVSNALEPPCCLLCSCCRYCVHSLARKPLAKRFHPIAVWLRIIECSSSGVGSSCSGCFWRRLSSMAMTKAEVKLLGTSCLEQNARTACGSCRWYLRDTGLLHWVRW